MVPPFAVRLEIPYLLAFVNKKSRMHQKAQNPLSYTRKCPLKNLSVSKMPQHSGERGNIAIDTPLNPLLIEGTFNSPLKRGVSAKLTGCV